MIKLIIAKDENGVIGNQGKLPWYIPEELKHFRKTTTGCTLLMGRKTYESISDKSFGNRNIVVLTKSKISGIKTITYSQIFSFFRKYKNSIADDLFICGGKMIYDEFYRYANELVITTIYGFHNGDVSVTFDLNGYYWLKSNKYDKYEINYYKKGTLGND